MLFFLPALHAEKQIPDSPPAATLAKQFPASFKVTHTITLKGSLDLSKAVEPHFLTGVALPESNEYQEISNLSVSGGEIAHYEGKKGSYVRYSGSAPLKTLTFSYRITTHKFFPRWNRIETIHPYDTARPDYIRYTRKDDGRIQADNPIIRKAADAIRRDSRNSLEYAKEAFIWEQKKLKWKPSSGGINEIFANGGGECSSLATVYISLLRNNGIPARYVTGYIIRNGKGESHVWSEFYLEKYGWFPADPAFIGTMENDPLYFGYYDGRRLFYQRGDDYVISDGGESAFPCGGAVCYWNSIKGGAMPGSYGYDVDVAYYAIDDGSKAESAFYNNSAFTADVQKTALAIINERRKRGSLPAFSFSQRLNGIARAYLDPESGKDPLKESGIRYNYRGQWRVVQSFPTLVPAERFASDFPWKELEKPEFNQLGIGYRYHEGKHQFYFVLLKAE